jgi:hypothetical protein
MLRGRLRSVAAYQGAAIERLSGVGALDGMVVRRGSGKEEDGRDRANTEESDDQGARPRAPAGCRSYQPTRRLRHGLPDTSDGAAVYLARRTQDASPSPIDHDSSAPAAYDASDASLETLHCSANSRPTSPFQRAHRVYSVTSTSSASPASSVASFHSSSSGLFLPLASSRASLLRTSSLTYSQASSRVSSLASVYSLRGGGGDGSASYSEESEWGRSESFCLDVSGCRNSLVSEDDVLSPSPSRASAEGREEAREEEEDYDIDEYYFGAYSMSSWRERECGGGVLGFREAFEAPCEDYRISRGDYRIPPRELVRADQSRRSGRILEGPYDIDHDERIMSPRKLTRAEPTWPMDRVREDSCKINPDLDGEDLMSLAEALRVDQTPYKARSLNDIHAVEDNRIISPRGTLCIYGTPKDPHGTDYDSYNKHLLSPRGPFRASETHHIDTILRELEHPTDQTPSPSAPTVAPRGYLFYLKEALSKLTPESLGDKTQKLIRIHTLHLNLCNSRPKDTESDNEKSESPEFVCRSSSAIAAGAHVQLTARTSATGESTSGRASCATPRSQGQLGGGTPDRASSRMGLWSGAGSWSSSSGGSRPSSRLSSRVQSRADSCRGSLETVSAREVRVAVGVPQCGKWRRRGGTRIKVEVGCVVSPALRTAKSAAAGLDVNKRLPALPKVNPGLQDLRDVEH